MKTILNFFRGILVGTLIAIITLPLSLIIVILGPITKILPFKSWRLTGLKMLTCIPQIWIALLNLTMKISSHGKWIINGPKNLDKNGCYILISNHTSWVDILVLNAYFNYKIPMIKFFMKKELKWQLPVAGLACWVLNYPFMERHTRAQVLKNPSLRGKDIETTRVACRKLLETPTTLVNFVEGTRFTPAKKERQQSPFKHLLKPHAGGLAVAIEELNYHLTGIIDATLIFPDKNMSFWKFISGDFSEVIIDYRIIPVTPELIGNYYDDREFRAHFQTWLNRVWQEKDDMIDRKKSP